MKEGLLNLIYGLLWYCDFFLFLNLTILAYMRNRRGKDLNNNSNLK